MKKLLYLLLIVPIFLSAELNIEKVSNVLQNLQSSKPLKFFNANKRIDLKNRVRFTSLEDANIILFSDSKNIKKMTIANSYKALQMNKNSIGAIYLKKGRTQIIFISERLKKNGLYLSSSFDKYILSECQLNLVCLLTNIK